MCAASHMMLLYMKRCHIKWHHCCQSWSAISKDKSAGGLLAANLDQRIHKTLSEAFLWEQLKFTLPDVVIESHLQRARIMHTETKVSAVAQYYNRVSALRARYIYFTMHEFFSLYFFKTEHDWTLTTSLHTMHYIQYLTCCMWWYTSQAFNAFHVLSLKELLVTHCIIHTFVSLDISKFWGNGWSRFNIATLAIRYWKDWRRKTRSCFMIGFVD